MAIDTAATDDNITLELELELEVPPPNDTSQNPSHFQSSVEPDRDQCSWSCCSKEAANLETPPETSSAT